MISPCGVCRQALSEFVDPATFPVLMLRSEQEGQIRTLQELLPYTFSQDDLGTQA
jgi:cytidine deaminase